MSENNETPVDNGGIAKGSRKPIANVLPQRSLKKMVEVEPHQEVLRDKLIHNFLANRAQKVIERKIQHINNNRELAEVVKILFDEEGKPTPHTPIEEIIDYRKNLEAQAQWLIAIAEELKGEIKHILELETTALKVLNQGVDH